MNDASLNTLGQASCLPDRHLDGGVFLCDYGGPLPWIEQARVRFDWRRLGKADKGLLQGYVQKLTGLHPHPLTRLIAAGA